MKKIYRLSESDLIKIIKNKLVEHSVLIFEASKKDVLINKLGFSKDNAETLANAAGPFAVWLGNKLIDVYANKYLEIHLRDYSQIFPSPEQKEKIKSEIADPKKKKTKSCRFFKQVGRSTRKSK
jgi:hypothetical protein